MKKRNHIDLISKKKNWVFIFLKIVKFSYTSILLSLISLRSIFKTITNMEKIIYSIICAGALSVSSCSTRYYVNCNGYTPSGVIKTEIRNVSDYNKVSLESAINIKFHQGDKYSLTVAADENMLPFIKTETSNETLFIDNEKCNCPGKVTIEITLPELEKVDLRGAGNVDFPEDFKFGKFEMAVAGAGDVKLRGTADDVDIKISGAGDIDAGKLKADNAKVTISGSGDIDIYAEKSLDINISGSGDVTCHGNAQNVKQRISGSGKIRSNK